MPPGLRSQVPVFMGPVPLVFFGTACPLVPVKGTQSKAAVARGLLMLFVCRMSRWR